ncbi:outer membrane lipoprotein chaperone LolA [Motilimonas pumila]|uniref:Outer-membrane lipoprotein carrier protein n=1 Tax=Motilimonas pumila TaxID=2303987 RepID=A0A418YGK7_9GAMM|nr:outer membrane lipoprotein chaperone LolA [Motilimonas pumila]RJG48728.1 outer membrane lipoprotein carrier protein LolA [Motilimonas pumila]
MKKLQLLVSSLCLFSSAVLADVQQELQQKLQSVAQFNAQFNQQVLDADGEVIQQAKGELTVSRPDRFKWQVTEPDEELVVSNGNTVWIYSPFVEQVTLLDQATAIEGTPFLLLASSDPKIWQKFDVSKKGQTYTITQDNPDAVIAEFVMTFNAKGELAAFSVKEAQGQSSEFSLSEFSTQGNYQKSDFEFIVPQGVEIDDQR